MDSYRYAKRLLALIDADIAALDECILSGSAADLVAYRAAVGRRQGLLASRKHVTTALGTDGRELDTSS